MASKLFTGDMPELLDILNNLNDEFLYHILMLTCKSTLVQNFNPYSLAKSIFVRMKTLFIIRYISSLGKDEELVLKEYGINTEFSKTLFDYTKFLKALDLSRLKNTVEE
ncbi:hypothetical protein F8M41_025539 [Gigaspora margarita]|uniref:Uncharacterized protein n=1 Tax=Gigaspora margarita TaxID=4874 RepID=A0A8H3XIB8_GIGMA|nr:hypothetical protein F8M41_025539 [Gigaspora margarita]